MEEADRFWHDMMTVSALPADLPLWRLNVPPSALCSVVEAMEPVGAQWLCDWAGGLVWLALADGEQRVRDAALAAGGHATLVRAPEAMRARVCALQPQSPGVTALEQRVRRAFDPAGVFDTGRFADSTHAD